MCITAIINLLVFFLPELKLGENSVVSVVMMQEISV